MNKKLKAIIPYIITAIVTMTIVFSIALISEISLLWKSEKKIVKIELSKKIFKRFHTIEELEKRIQQNPNDYMSHIKLAQKYSELKEHDIANVYFQTALKISDRSNYSLYSYSMFCVEHKLYNLALNLAEEISLYNKKAIKYKAQIYEAIAISLDEDGEIEASIKAFQVALKYAKGVYLKEDLEELKTKYSKEYIKIADINIKKQKTEEAILDIKNSLKIKELPIAKYKLALIYKDTNKTKSEKLIAKVLERNPYLVNPYIYNNLLNDLVDEARLMGNSGKINYYTSKINTFNKLLSRIYIFKNDLSVSNIDIVPKKSMFFSKETIYLKLNIKNNTKDDIETLYILNELYYGNKKIELEKKVTTKAHILESGQTKTIAIKFPQTFTKDNITLANGIIIKCYAKKQKKAPWTLIKIQQLK